MDGARSVSLFLFWWLPAVRSYRISLLSSSSVLLRVFKMADTRLRKRSTRLSESDQLVLEELPKKRGKRKLSPALDRPGRPKRHRGESSSTPPSKAGPRKGRGGRSLKGAEDGRKRRGNRLLVSLNIQDNDLHLSKQVEGGGKVGTTPRPRGRGGRLANQQRDQSVVSDAGSNNGSGIGSGIGNGKLLAFKNPSFSVRGEWCIYRMFL